MGTLYSNPRVHINELGKIALAGVGRETRVDPWESASQPSPNQQGQASERPGVKQQGAPFLLDCSRPAATKNDTVTIQTGKLMTQLPQRKQPWEDRSKRQKFGELEAKCTKPHQMTFWIWIQNIHIGVARLTGFVMIYESLEYAKNERKHRLAGHGPSEKKRPPENSEMNTRTVRGVQGPAGADRKQTEYSLHFWGEDKWTKNFFVKV